MVMQQLPQQIVHRSVTFVGHLLDHRTIVQIDVFSISEVLFRSRSDIKNTVAIEAIRLVYLKIEAEGSHR